MKQHLHKPLTHRQLQVVEAIAERGFSTKMVAQSLGRSCHTVNNTLRAIYEHLNINSNTELVAWWFRTNYDLISKKEKAIPQ